MTSRYRAKVLMTMVASLAAGACNLDLETAEHPYTVSLVFDDDAGTPEPDVPTSGETDADGGEPVDMAPPGDPDLVFTEILINTSTMDPSIALGELGEYVEIKNVGDGPADPRAISMRLTNIDNDTSGDIFIATAVSQEQIGIISNLKPVMPGDYFVFVRYSTVGIPVSEVVEEGRYYDFGRYGEGVPMSNSDERVLEVRYNDGAQIVTTDQIRWRNGNFLPADGGEGPTLNFEEDDSIALRPGNEDPAGNDSPDAWCISTNDFGGIVAGTPGGPAQCE